MVGRLFTETETFRMLDQTRAYGLSFLFPAGDLVIGGSLKLYGEFAPVEVKLLSDYIRHFGPSGHFIDIGANIGAISLPLAKAHEGWAVTAIEGHRGLAQVLSANAFSNFLTNVEVINAAAGEASRLAVFPKASLTEEGNFGILGIHLNDARPTENVRMLTLDEVSTPRSHLIKMDVEGYEAHVLQGGIETLKTVRPVILFEAAEAQKATVTACVAQLTAHGYETFWLYSPFVTPKNRKKNVVAGDFDRGDFSILALPNEVPNLWNLSPVSLETLEWPMRKGDFPYLSKFGYWPST